MLLLLLVVTMARSMLRRRLYLRAEHLRKVEVLDRDARTLARGVRQQRREHVLALYIDTQHTRAHNNMSFRIHVYAIQ